MENELQESSTTNTGSVENDDGGSNSTGLLEVVRNCQRSSFLQKQEILEYDYAVTRRIEEGRSQEEDRGYSSDRAGGTIDSNSQPLRRQPRRPRHQYESSVISEGGNREVLKAIALHHQQQEQGATTHTIGQNCGTEDPQRQDATDFDTSSNESASPESTNRRESIPGAYSGLPGCDLTRNAKVRFSQIGRCRFGPSPTRQDSNAETLPSSSSDTSLVMTSLDEQDMAQGDYLAIARALRASELGKSPSELPLAEEMDGSSTTVREESSKDMAPVAAAGGIIRRYPGLVYGCGVILMVVLVLLVVMLVYLHYDAPISTSKEDASPRPRPPPVIHKTPAVSPEDHLLSLLPKYTIPEVQFKDETPQGEAFQWLLHDPNFSSYNDKRLRQRFALATIYFSTHGPRWDPGWHKDDNNNNNSHSSSGWLDYSRHECDWDYYMPGGLYYDTGHDHKPSRYKYIDGLCHILNATSTTNVVSFYDAKNASSAAHYDHAKNESNAQAVLPTVADDITCLVLFGRKLDGKLPKEIKMLTALKVVNLERTTLEGTIPSVLMELTGLEELHLSHSSFHGTIPTELALLTNLEVFDVDGTAFTGTLPSELALLTNMRDLKIVETSLNGTIPTEYGRLRPMDLQLYRNRLTGTIPTQLGLLSTTRWFMLERNQLNGTVPTQLGQLETALILYLQENHQLTGTIPTELGLLRKARQIYLSANQLTGGIPTELGNTHEILWRLKLDDNFLTGTVPSEIGKLTKMQSLGLNGNMLTGTIPLELGDKPDLEYLRLHDNQFRGSVMDIFWNSTKMLNFSVSTNHFTGTIPPTIGYSWRKLQHFDIRNNQITASIASELGLLKDLKTFLVGFNHLTGIIPTQLGLLVTNASLRFFGITNNEGLSGMMPEDLCILGYPVHSRFAGLGWDCTDNLCGCNCSCSPEMPNEASSLNNLNTAPGGNVIGKLLQTSALETHMFP